jgi:hypothetical protein
MKSYFHGHKIIYKNDQWVYADTKKPIIEDSHRACKKCGFGFKDYDACLGKLPGVINACCGHGVDEGYIQFENGVIIRGIFKVEKAKEQG